MHVKVGYFLHPVQQFIPKPLQHCKCLMFGQVSAVCQSRITCSRCTEAHATNYCTATALKCRNCLGSHDASSNDCPKIQKKKDILKHMVPDRSFRWEAVAVVRMWRSQRRSGSRDSVTRSSQVTGPPLLQRLYVSPSISVVVDATT